MTQVSKNLQAFVERALAITPQGHFWMPFDPDWRSPCELEFRREQAGTQVAWRPLPQTTRVSFDGLANALEQPIHPDICTYFSCYWSGSLEAQTNDGHVSLIQLWNLEDFDRLIENLIGHSLAKRQQREPFTVFFATTDLDSELFLSIDNLTGQVLLEEPGKPPLRTVAASVADFLDTLTPVASLPGLY